jgi:ubiquinone/menaquinone biosynthesis C-methylase UbiE
MEKYKSANEKTYNEPYVIRYYAKMSGLTDQEQAVLRRISPDVQGKRILDVGIGAGRTIPELKKISDSYVGIDYAQGMVEHCKAKFPDDTIFLCDARAMTCFDDEQFQLVFFSFNGIDNVKHDDRIRIIKEIWRVLAVGGYFVFSSHNRDCMTQQELSKKKSGIKGELVSLAVLLKNIAKSPSMANPEVKKCINRCKYKWREVQTDQYALLNDPGHDYSTLQYYISASRQVQQLLEAGFKESPWVFDSKGQIVKACRDSPWLYYCAQK